MKRYLELGKYLIKSFAKEKAGSAILEIVIILAIFGVSAAVITPIVRTQLAEKGQPLQQEIQRRQNEERNKLLALIKQAIDAVAAKDGYDMVFNANSVAFTSEEHDLSERVLEQVNKIN